VSSTSSSLTLDLDQGSYDSLVPGSLDLEGLGFSQALQTTEAGWLKTQEGQPVTLTEDGKSSTVTLIRASDLLIRDAAGRYRAVQFAQLSFQTLPPENPRAPSRRLTYTLERPGSGTLSYLTRAVTWSPRYTLKATGSGAVLSALADLRNGSSTAFNVDKAELFAGQVDIEEGQPMPASVMMSRTTSFDVAQAAPKISSLGELRGLYRYGLDGKFTLPANGALTLPFAAPRLTTFDRFARLSSYFSGGTSTGNLERAYRLKADAQLPGGPVTVREDGRIVGQTSLPETAAGNEMVFGLGRDPDVTYTRTAETRATRANVTTATVTFVFANAKDRPIRAELTEQVGGRKITIDRRPVAPNSASIELKVDVPAKGTAKLTYTVVIDNSEG
jgi:hypothetical protein